MGQILLRLKRQPQHRDSVRYRCVPYERYVYDAYGTPYFRDGSRTPVVERTTDNPYLFQGRRYDTETGLYYYRNRYYSPDLGRFMQRDPMGYVDGMGLYEFVGGRVTVAVDPMGSEARLLYPPTEETIPPSVPKSEAPFVCCKEWTKWWQILYGKPTPEEPQRDKVAKCFWWEFSCAYPTGRKIIETATVGGGLTYGGFIKGAVGARAGKIAGYYLIYTKLQFLWYGGDAAEKCTSVVCTRFAVPKRVKKYRAWYNPMRIFRGDTYECWGCPDGSEEAPTPGEDGWVRKNPQRE